MTQNFAIDSIAKSVHRYPRFETSAIRVLIRHSDPLICAGLTATLQPHSELEILSSQTQANQSNEAHWGNSEPNVQAADVVIADYAYGVTVAMQSRTATALHRPRAPQVLIVTQRESEWEIRNAFEQGARGYLLLTCDAEEVLTAIQNLHRGMRHISVLAASRLAESPARLVLTNREVDVLRCISNGGCNKTVAKELNISIGTVKSHLKSIFGKMGAKSRTEVAMLAERSGLFNQSPAKRRSQKINSAPLENASERAGPQEFRAFGSSIH